ncbi:hypothetical protein [Roseibium sp. MB-4]
MMIQKTVMAAALALACTVPTQTSADQLEPGDTYIISRDGHRIFRGSHQIYNRMAEGLVEVTYCQRSYWVRYATVAWTQLEVDRGYELRVEYNRGKGWRPICANPEEQVTLADLGINEDPRLIIQEDGPLVNPISRFAAISKSFGSGDKAKGSYHATE